MTVYLDIEEDERRTLSRLENTLFSELKTSDLGKHPIVADEQIFVYCDLIDSWKSTWLKLSASYPVPVGPGGIRKEEFIELIKFKKEMEKYLKLRQKYSQYASMPKEIVAYAQSVIKRMDESLSDLDDGNIYLTKIED